jgi:hypothetical protein
MTTATTARSQRLEALEVGNRIRLKGAAFRREVAAAPRPDGFRMLAEALEKPDDVIASIQVGRFLRSVFGVGGDRVDIILAHSGVGPRRVIKRVGDLTVRERSLLAAELERRADK